MLNTTKDKHGELLKIGDKVSFFNNLYEIEDIIDHELYLLEIGRLMSFIKPFRTTELACNVEKYDWISLDD